MPSRAVLKEKEWYIKDTEEFEHDREKNSYLSELLDGVWNDLAIVRIQRIEIGSSKGWQVTYRE